MIATYEFPVGKSGYGTMDVKARSTDLEPNADLQTGDATEIAAAPALPLAGTAAVPLIAAAVVASLGLSWASLSPTDQAKVLGSVTAFFATSVDAPQTFGVIVDMTKSGFTDAPGALERNLSADQLEGLEAGVKDAVSGLGPDGTPEPEEDRRLADDLSRRTKDKDDDPDIAFRAVFRRARGTGDTKMGSAYFEVPTEPGEVPQNVVVNRLVQTADGHDVTHALTGLGLNGIGADRIGAAFPATGIDVEEFGLGPPEPEQRNVNGIYIELLNDAFYEAMIDGDRIDFAAAVDKLPEGLQEMGDLIRSEIHDTTGYRATNQEAEPGTDYGRQAIQADYSEVAIADAHPDIDGAMSVTIQRRFVDIAKERFAALLDTRPDVKQVLNGNLETALEYLANLSLSTVDPDHPHPGGLTMLIPPEQMEPILETAIAALGDIIAEVRREQPDHVPEGLIELQNFYQNILDGAGDGTPELAMAQTDPLA